VRPVSRRRRIKGIIAPYSIFQMNYGMDEIRYVLPREKPPKTTGRPIVTFRKVLDGILYILRTGCQWKLVPAEYGSGSTCHRRNQEWIGLDIFKKVWIRLLQPYDNKKYQVDLAIF
jgi:transposase